MRPGPAHTRGRLSPFPRIRPGRALRPAALLVLMLGPVPLSAQDFPFQRDYPGGPASSCPDVEQAPGGSEEARIQALEMASIAEQSIILGDLPRALLLLERATELDPASPDLAYRRARALEESGDSEAAVAEYCRMMGLRDPAAPDQDPRARLDAMAGAERARFPGGALIAFREGLAAVDGERFGAAAEAFGAARRQAPLWADAAYNQGLALDRVHRSAEAAEALLRYLELRPESPNAMEISQRIGLLQSLALAAGPSPGTALTLGVLFPGLGQFYSGRPLGGFMVLVAAGGAVATGFLLEEVNLRCLDPNEAGGSCPVDQVVSSRTERPYLMAGLGAAAVVGVLGALEAFVHLRRQRSRAPSFPAARPRRDAPSGPVLERPSVSTSPGVGRIDVNLLRLRFQ